MELGSQIRKRRTDAGLSQGELAAKLFVSRQTLSNWETEKTFPDAESLLLISNFFNVSLDDLLKKDLKDIEAALSAEFSKMSALSWGGTFVALLGALAFAFDVIFLKWGMIPSLIISILIIGIGVTMIYKSEMIMKRYDLVTYQEILSFAKNEPIDRNNLRSMRARKHRPLKMAAILVISGAIGGIIGCLGVSLGIMG